MKRFFCAFFCLAALAGAPTPCWAATFLPSQHALAMVDRPLYPEGFSCFHYADPHAPQGGTLTLGATGTFDSLNPFIVRGQAPLGVNSGVMSLIYESLMTRGWDEPFTLYGQIAQSVNVAKDRSGIIFNLNPKARFSDGTPVTADDVLFSFRSLRDKGRPNHRTYYKKVSVAKKLSPSRVEFLFKPNPDGSIDREMPLIMGLMPIVPEHDWKNRPFNETSLHPPVGSGPYRIKSVEPGRSIVYERNRDYWGNDLPVRCGLYNFDTIRVDFYRDDSVALQAFKAGQYDLRAEASPTHWAQAYDFPAARDGRVRLETLAHQRTEPAYGFILNTRRPLFADPALREALQYTFDFTWVNKTLFYGGLKRVNSVFPNSELAAPPLPTGLEKTILEKFKAHLPADIFSKSVRPPEAESQRQFRKNLLKAERLLKAAGYKLRDGVLVSPQGIPVSFEILLSDPVEEKIALNWKASLRRLGIDASVHTVDSAQYQARLAAFDYDVTANKWINSLSPGNEQSYFWSSASAAQQGSRNYAGVHDPVVDALATALPNAASREELVATARALDRVLMRGHYFVPLYYEGADHIASWTRVNHPKTLSLYGNVLPSWFSIDPGK
ncbi:MAG: extracellular solute-binding protein [Alphaproteobacteria bacterium]|nr:extracellular solute-binding protein [Alphaproteobacteria bacterium]